MVIVVSQCYSAWKITYQKLLDVFVVGDYSIVHYYKLWRKIEEKKVEIKNKNGIVYKLPKNKRLIKGLAVHTAYT